jgi:hypothetical protein
MSSINDEIRRFLSISFVFISASSELIVDMYHCMIFSCRLKVFVIISKARKWCLSLFGGFLHTFLYKLAHRGVLFLRKHFHIN